MIILLKQPQKFTPINNPVLFSFSSDTQTLLYYRIEVRNQANEIVSVLKYDAFPANGSLVSFDLAETLRPFIKSELINNGNIIEPLANTTFKFRLRITGWYRFDGLDVEGASYITDYYTVWDAGFNRVDFHSYQYQDYAFTASGNTKFLSGKPPVSNIYSTDTEYLYLLNDSQSANVQINFYGAGHVLLGSHSLSGITSGTTGYRINVSPEALNSYFGLSLSNMYGGEFADMFDLPFGTAFNIDSANYYTVQVINSGGTAISELKTYVMKSHKCNIQSFQLIYSNQLGGFDQITLFNPKESIDVTRTTIKYNSYSDDIINGVFQESTGIINANFTSTYKAITGVLSDPEARAIKDIIKAKGVYLSLSNGLLLPVSISNSNYSVQLKKYSTNNNRVQIEFTSPEAGLFD